MGIYSYPDGTVLAITISDTKTKVSFSASGTYVTMIEAFALFKFADGQFFVRLPSDFVAPCFCRDLPGEKENLTAEARVFEQWRLSRLKQMADFVQENLDSEDPGVISTLGALQIPHAKRQLATLQTTKSQKVQALARKSAEVWQTIRQRVCL